MRDLWTYLGQPARYRFVGALTLSALAGAFGVFLLGLSGWFLTASAVAGLMGAGAAFNHLFPSGGIRFAALGRVASRYGEQLIGHDATLSLSATLRPDVFRAQANTARGYASMPSGELATLIDDVDAAEAGFLKVYAPMAGVFASVIIALGFIALADLATAVLALAVIGLAGIALPRWLGRRKAANANAQAQAMEDGRRTVSDLVEHAVELDTLNALLPHSDLAEQRLHALHTDRLALEAAFRPLGALHTACGGLLAVFVMWRVHDQSEQVALAAGAALATLAAFDALSALVRAFDAAPRSLTGASRLLDRLRREPQVAQPNAASIEPLASPFPICAEELVVSPAADGPRIGPVSFAFPAGSVLVIEGPSGCGKTTLVETLLRLHPATSGTLSYSGRGSDTVRTAQILSLAGLSPQIPGFLPGSVREQFLLAHPDICDEDIWACLEAVGLRHVIEARTEGLSFALTDFDAGFSGGEQRRLSIARAIATGHPLLVLDEPFAGLDDAHAQGLVAALSAWLDQKPDRGLLIVTHDGRALAALKHPVQRVILPKL